MLWFKLISCKHSNTSLPTGSDLVTCFDCGSTKRGDEAAWLRPWLWRTFHLQA
jgi:hypothetical protein